MSVPATYLGSWTGHVSDVNRKNGYRGEITISADGAIATTYHMRQGIQHGSLTAHCASNGFLLLREDTGSFHGTLLLYMDAASELRSVWRTSSGFSSEATMTRATSAGSGK